MTKTCTNCSKRKQISDFYKKGNGFHSRCKKCLYKIDRQRKVARRIKVVQIMGGKCLRCSYDKNYAALDIHHKDPSKKKITGQQLKEKPWNEVMEEIKQCELLCKNCHMETHHPQLNKRNDLDLPLPDPLLTMKCGKCLICDGQTFSTTFCSTECAARARRKVKRPRKATLARKIKKTSWSSLGREYGVSDNAVRKWAKSYGLL